MSLPRSHRVGVKRYGRVSEKNLWVTQHGTPTPTGPAPPRVQPPIPHPVADRRTGGRRAGRRPWDMVAEVRHLWDPQVGNFSENLDTFFRNNFDQAMNPSHPNQKTNSLAETFLAPVSAHPNLTEEHEHPLP